MPANIQSKNRLLFLWQCCFGPPSKTNHINKSISEWETEQCFSVFLFFFLAWWTDLQRAEQEENSPLMIRLAREERVCAPWRRLLKLISWLRDEGLLGAVFNLLNRKRKVINLKRPLGAFKSTPRAGNNKNGEPYCENSFINQIGWLFERLKSRFSPTKQS